MFVDTFCELCDKRGVSPNKACIDMGISRTSTAKWKSGSVPNGQTLSKIADYFGVTTDYLLGAETKKEPSTDNGEKLSAAEAELLKLFRLVPEDKREMVLGMIRIAVGNR